MSSQGENNMGNNINLSMLSILCKFQSISVAHTNRNI